MNETILGILLSNYAETMAIMAEIEGMKALNQYRAMRGETIAYPEESFTEKANALYAVSENCILVVRQ